MPILNKPIIPNRALGRQKKLLGFFPFYLAPGLLAGFVTMAIASEITKDKVKAIIFGSSVIAAYWLYAGRGEESSWSNFGRFLPIPIFHISTQPNKDTLPPQDRL